RDGRPDGTEAVCPGQDGASVAWAPLPDGRALLASVASEGLSLWDGHTVERLHIEPLVSDITSPQNLDWALTQDRKLLLAAASADGLIRVGEVVLDPPADRPEEPRAPRAVRTADERTSRERLVLPPQEITPEFPEARVIDETTYDLDLVNMTDDRTMV